MITVKTDKEEVLAITRRKSKVYPNSTEEKRKLGEARAEIEKATQAKTSQLKDTTSTSARNSEEQNIVRQILQTEIPFKISDLLTMPQLQTAILNYTPFLKATKDTRRNSSGMTATDPMLLALTMVMHLTIVEMGILGNVLTDTIVNGGSDVNVLPKDT